MVKQVAPLLAEVYSHVATVRIRNVATVGGGIAHADPSQDPPPGLIVLDAKVQARLEVGRARRRRSDGFFKDYYETAIEPGELLTEVIVPPQPAGARTAYLKFLPRTADDYATVAVAAMATVEGGVCAACASPWAPPARRRSTPRPSSRRWWARRSRRR